MTRINASAIQSEFAIATLRGQIRNIQDAQLASRAGIGKVMYLTPFCSVYLAGGFVARPEP